jgi:hypothetical protein
MAGTTGLEPAASAVTVLRVMLRRMRRNECKLHECKGVGHFSPSALYRETLVYTHLQGHGYEGYVTSHVTNFEPGTAEDRFAFVVLFGKLRDFSRRKLKLIASGMACL